MVAKTYLIADSGGTSTSWCYVDEIGEKNYFDSESFHPHNFNSAFFERAKVLFLQQGIAKNTWVYFYGASCSLPMNQQKLCAFFEEIDFNVAEVNSDLLGACRGALRDQKGLLAIMGTGSIVAAYDGNDIVETKGGFGFLIGDEGSGFCAGKLILHAYLNETFTPNTQAQLKKILGNKVDVLQHIYGENGKSWIGNVPKSLPKIDEIEQLNLKNIQAFFELSLLPLKQFSRDVAIIGSYGAHFSAEIALLMNKMGFSLSKVVKSPIELIVSAVLLNEIKFQQKD